MNIYFAPMEGVTSHLMRRIHHEFYPGITKYFIPFIEPHEKRDFNPREQKDIAPENNRNIYAVPQILTRDAEGFLTTASHLVSKGGYKEINLNLGCPSGTVVAKGKGSGFLKDTEELDRFLDRIFASAPCGISIKTRIGRFQPEEFEELLRIYEKYPLRELIIHPRTREDYYKAPTRPEVYELAYNTSSHILCYNGDIRTPEEFQTLQNRFPRTENWMIGRGLLWNPQLAEQIISGTAFDPIRFRAFYNRMYQEYKAFIPTPAHLLMKMKELWSYWIVLFPADKKLEKQLKKAKSIPEYETAVQLLFHSLLT